MLKPEDCTKFTCDHEFCNDCLHEYYLPQLKNNKIPICPEYECEKFVPMSIIERLIKNNDLLLRFKLFNSCYKCSGEIIADDKKRFITCINLKCENFIKDICNLCNKIHKYHEWCNIEKNEITNELYRNLSGVTQEDINILFNDKYGTICPQCCKNISKIDGCDYIKCNCGQYMSFILHDFAIG